MISMYWPATETPAPYSPGTRKGSGPNLQRAESHQYGHGHRHNRKWPRKRFSPVRSARHEPRTRSETADHVSRRVALPTSELRNVVEVAPVHGDCGAALEGGAGQAHRPYRDPGQVQERALLLREALPTVERDVHVDRAPWHRALRRVLDERGVAADPGLQAAEDLADGHAAIAFVDRGAETALCGLRVGERVARLRENRYVTRI